MYRVGLGDCFLLSFGAAAQVHVLIDCGVLLGTADATQGVEACIEDVRQATNGHLHVVVATHEHWDHVGGFAQASAVFDKFKTIDQIWFAWTEDPDDALAKRLRDERTKR
jgi:glyoxylase-like metal-dependent hydrolase (beta-lactamase superfamily II)